MSRFTYGGVGLLVATGLLVAGCCPSHQSTQVPKMLLALQSSLDRMERLERKRARRGAVGGHRSAGKLPESCGRLRSDLARFRGYCPCKDQITPLAADLVLAEASLALLSSRYRSKHPRVVVALRRVAVLKKYLKIHRANGQRIDHCRLRSYLISETYRVERRHAELSTRYLKRHPEVSLAATQLGVLRKALQAARVNCPKPRP